MQEREGVRWYTVRFRVVDHNSRIGEFDQCMRAYSAEDVVVQFRYSHQENNIRAFGGRRSIIVIRPCKGGKHEHVQEGWD